MAKSKYLTAPLPSEKMPAGIPYILTNEAAERFSFYGMSFHSRYVYDAHLMGRVAGPLNVMGNEESKTWFHLFNCGCVFYTSFGALISDIWLGKYRTIFCFLARFTASVFSLWCSTKPVLDWLWVWFLSQSAQE